MKLNKIIFMTVICIYSATFYFGIKYIVGIDENKYYTKKEMEYSNLNNTPTTIRQEFYKLKSDNEKPVNLVVFGLDRDNERSDVIIVLNLDYEKKTINMLSLARDTMVKYRGANTKINSLIGNGGEKRSIEKIEEITGMDIQYYLTVDLSCFKKIINMLDGVEVNIPFDMNYDDPVQNLHIHLNKGTQILNGDQAEQYVRYRKGNYSGQGYSNGDIGRIGAQQELMKALLNQKLKLRYISKVNDIYTIIIKNIRTNISLKEAVHYSGLFMEAGKYTINSYTLPGEPSTINGIWYYIYDAEKGRDLIETNFSK